MKVVAVKKQEKIGNIRDINCIECGDELRIHPNETRTCLTCNSRYTVLKGQTYKIIKPETFRERFSLFMDDSVSNNTRLNIKKESD